MEEALGIFQDMVARGCERNVITYSSLIVAAEKAGRWQLALELLEEMHRDGCSPNAVTFNTILSACAQGAAALLPLPWRPRVRRSSQAHVHSLQRQSSGSPCKTSSRSPASRPRAASWAACSSGAAATPSQQDPISAQVCSSETLATTSALCCVQRGSGSLRRRCSSRCCHAGANRTRCPMASSSLLMSAAGSGAALSRHVPTSAARLCASLVRRAPQGSACPLHSAPPACSPLPPCPPLAPACWSCAGPQQRRSRGGPACRLAERGAEGAWCRRQAGQHVLMAGRHAVCVNAGAGGDAGSRASPGCGCVQLRDRGAQCQRRAGCAAQGRAALPGSRALGAAAAHAAVRL